MQQRTKWIAVSALAGVFAGLAFGAPCTKVRPYEDRLGIASSPVVIVSDVVPGSIAERAGLRPGDVILSSNGKTARHGATFQDMISRIREQALWRSADLVIMRSGVRRYATLLLTTPEERFGFTSSFGFYVESVTIGSVGDRAGMKAGDFIRKVNGQETGSMQGAGDMDLAIQLAVDGGNLSMELARLVSAEGGTTIWTVRETTVVSVGPLDGPTPPPGMRKPEIIKQ